MNRSRMPHQVRLGRCHLRRLRRSRTDPHPPSALKAAQLLSPPQTTQSLVAQAHASSSLAPLTTPTVSKAVRQARRRISPTQMAARPLLRRRRGRLASGRASNRRTPSVRRSARNHPAAASARPNARRSISRLAPNAKLQPAALLAAGRMAIEHRFGVGTSLRMTECRGKVGMPIKRPMNGMTGPQIKIFQLRAFPVERRTSIKR
jgi:hypothetical protein